MQEEYRSFPVKSDQGLSVWKIALGVCIGSLAASAITWATVEVRLRWELERATVALEESAARSRNAAYQAQQNAALLLREKEQSEAAQQRAENDARLATQAEAVRRENAWKRFYKPKPGCEFASTSTECVNDHIRAKRAFDLKYAAGEL